MKDVQKLRIAIDAMGGDNSPGQIVQGCIDAINTQQGFELVLVGNEKAIKKLLERNKKVDKDRISIVHTPDVITNEDSPVTAIKKKTDSSMVVGLNLLKDGKIDAFLSAGNTGALMAGALLIVGRIKGVDRPALAPFIPTIKGKTMLIDAGANTDCRPLNYKQFAIMGSIYMNKVFNIKNPNVGLVNVGVEETKGNSVIRQAFKMLSETNLNFIGNIEGREIMQGKVDIIVCDGFVGNVVLKTIEGTAEAVFSLLKRELTKNVFSKLIALPMKKGMRRLKKENDYTEYGGAPFIGIDGAVIKCHGSSNSKSIQTAILQAKSFVESGVVQQIREDFVDMEVDSIALE